MDELERNNCNALIAEFMGYEYIPYRDGSVNRPFGWRKKHVTQFFHDENMDIGFPPDKQYLGRSKNDLLFHYSMDWLSPVIQQIQHQGCIIEIALSLGVTCKIMKVNPFNVVASMETNDPKETIWRAVVQYITWYNLTKENKV